jgi:hypothetical protein
LQQEQQLSLPSSEFMPVCISWPLPSFIIGHESALSAEDVALSTDLASLDLIGHESTQQLCEVSPADFIGQESPP